MRIMTVKYKTNKNAQAQGWRTSDEDEIERRRQRGAAENGRIKTINTAHPFYGEYQYQSDNGGR